MNSCCRNSAGKDHWEDQKGGFPLNELFISALIMIALLAGSLFGFITGNWIALQTVGVVLGIIIVASLVFGFFEDLAYTCRERVLYNNLVHLLKLSKENSDMSAIKDASKRVLSHEQFPTVFRRRSEALLELYQLVHPSQQNRARAILLKSVPFELQTLELFLATPVVGNESKTSFRHWLGCKPDVLEAVLELFQRCLADEPRGDHAALSYLIICLATSMPDPKYAEALKPFRSYLEAHRESFDEWSRERVDRYIEYWDAEDDISV